ncbi:insulin-like peptide receptor isoform X1 [Parasteatoda tepidariorum]|nr:insulin-like peptide receptor [Parasteatoda tepidariorum]
MGRRSMPPLLHLVLLLVFLLSTGEAQRPDRYEKVCRSIDIRNKVENFKKLENCTVIEGSLQILLIDHGKAQDYDYLSFPNLVEITDYLLVYRAFGLNSLGKLFPNLAVIRGNELFHNYALVVFELYQLQEIGLSNLTDILRGSVRIEKNPGLCYVETIEWDLIAKEGKGGHFIKGNKKSADCPNTCPGPPTVCPKSTEKPTYLCWNSQKCQKISPCIKKECDLQNSSCYNSTHCCHPECLGGCTGPLSSDCTVCRHVVWEGKCMKKCPPNTYEFMNRRCVREDECRNFSISHKHSSGGEYPKVPDVYYKPFQSQCTTECPSGYIVDDNNPHVCKKCRAKCPKVCAPMTVDHVGAAQNYKGCTRINGSLEIHIQGGSNVIKELEENLNMVEQIDGYLKIARSFPLVSLNFLKSLTVIKGDTLDKKDYSLLVLDNQNLQELWDWKLRTNKLKILNGKIFFHFNSKLCPSKIQELKTYAEVADWDERDVSPSSNGDRVACDVTNMNVTVRNASPSIVTVKWDSFGKNLIDDRSLLGYVIYYRETLFRNISIFEGRDACGTDAWTVRDVEYVENTNNFIIHNITGLKPFTQYALYIRTYTTASGRQGAQSSIVYFKTLSNTPSPPVNIKARSTVHNEIVVSWKPPKNPNGNVTYYIVEGLYEEDTSYFMYQRRNYCLEPIAYPDYRKSIYDDESTQIGYFENVTSSSESTENECCSCSKDQHRLGDDDEEAESQIHFEDFLQNKVYIRNPNSYKVKRHIMEFLSDGPESSFSSTSPASQSGDEVTQYKNGNLLHFKEVVRHNPFLVVTNLKHFTEYTIEVRACQDKSEKNIEPCSIKAITSVRTLHLAGADDIRSSSVHILTENVTAYSSFIRWEDPKDSNGVIVAFTIEYKKVNGENHKAKRICVTKDQFHQHGGYFLSELPPGNYSLRIRATSMAGHGNWTSLVYFHIVAASESSATETILVVGIILFLCIAIGTIYGVYRFKVKQRIPDYVDYASVNPEYMSSNLVYVADEWEIARDKVKLLDELGQGSFGMVYKGEVRDMGGKAFQPCAAKTVNESASLRERIEFLQEASVMKAFNCHHVIKLMGVVSKGQPTLVIMELMTNGDLKTFLRSRRPDENPGQVAPAMPEICKMAAEIADGMAYLAAKKFVHRDLAARNCMVSTDLTVKIGDFGMTRDVYETDYYRKGGKGLLPVRWMSPESLKDGIFDSQTDVWSYGVVLWEMATLASQPYQGLSNEDVLKFVIAGNTMDRPEDCPDLLFEVMTMCWNKNPKARPTFLELVEMFLPHVENIVQDVFHYFMYKAKTENDDSVTPNTPLRSSMREEESNDHDYRYFPSATMLPEEDEAEEIVNGGELVEATISSVDELRTVHVNSNDGSKGVSVNYSDGSKGSKISTLSNGSIANGHAYCAKSN